MTWAIATLGDVCDIISGATPRTSEKKFWGGNILWTTPKDLSDLDGRTYLERPPRTITEEGLKSCAASLLPENSILLSSRAPIGLVAINAVPMATNQGFKSLVPDSRRVDSKFLFHWLKSKTSFLQGLGNGATFKEISKGVVERIKIPLPPLDEQRRITAILDQADALRRKRKRALDLLDSLTQSIFLEMFGEPIGSVGYRVESLGEVLREIESGWSPICLDRSARDDEPGVLKLGAVTSFHYAEEENKALPPQLQPKANTEVVAGDILFCRKNTRELVGSSVYVWETRRNLHLSDLIFRLVPEKSKIDAIFLQTQISLSSMRRKISEMSGGAAGSMPNVSKGRLRELEVILPSFESQIKFAATARHHRAMRIGYLEWLKHSNSLFSSLQSRAFSGQL